MTVVTGFLGAGKTTVLRELLRQSQQRLAVLVNEFGEVGIDGQLLKSCQVCDEDDASHMHQPLLNWPMVAFAAPFKTTSSPRWKRCLSKLINSMGS